MGTRAKKRDRRQRRKRRQQALKAVPSELQIIEATEDTALSLEAADGEGEEATSLRRFSMTAYTGGKLAIEGFLHPVVVDLSGMKVPAKSRPILRDHHAEKVVGHSTEIAINAASIRLSGVISAANDHAREVAESADNGFPWQASIGALARRMAFVDRNERVQVNGRTFTGPLYVARQSTLREVSFVTLGADDNTSAKFAASARKVGVVDMDFEQWLEARGFDPGELSDDQRGALQAAYNAEQTPDDPNPDEDRNAVNAAETPAQPPGDDGSSLGGELEQFRSERAGEVRRVRRIGQICAEYGNPTVEVAGEEVPLEAHAVEQGWSVEQTELQALRASRPQAPAVQTGGEEASGTVLSAALCLAAGRTGCFWVPNKPDRAPPSCTRSWPVPSGTAWNHGVT